MRASVVARSAVASPCPAPAGAQGSGRATRALGKCSIAIRNTQQPRLRGRSCGLAAQRRAVAAPAAAAQEQPPSEAQQQESALQSFLRWVLANGVEGVGSADSKIALYEGEGGERGVVSMQPIAAGEVVMRIPLRLAITDAVDEETEAAEGEAGEKARAEAEQPWSVRLAGRLLGMLAEGQEGSNSALLQCQAEKEEEGDLEEEEEAGAGSVAALSVAQLQAGSASPWQPYLRVLPESVPSPLTAFTWEDVQAVEYSPMRKALDHASWLASSASQLPAGRRFSREQWEWALSVVHSRTFGSPGRQGGVGVRMLVPLIDMLNHAGDYVTSPPGASVEPSVQAFDSVRWELRAPIDPEGEWHMEVAATRDIGAGEELLLSYGERSNDDFFLHYGFVPPRNPHDDVALFTDIESCIDWWLDLFLPPGTLPPARLQAAINMAYSAAEDQDTSSMAAAAVLDAVPEAEADAIREGLAKIKLSAGGMVDGRLLAAFRCLYEAGAEAGPAGSGASPPLQQQQPQQEQPLGRNWGEHLRLAVAARCRQILHGMPTPLLADLSRLAEWEHQSGEQQHGWAAAQRHYSAAVGAYEAQHGSVHEEVPQPPSSSMGGEPAVAAEKGGPNSSQLLDAGADAALAQLLLSQARALQAQQEQADGSVPGSSGGSAGEPGGSGDGRGCSLLPVFFRCYKKMVLWDAVLLGAE